MNKSLNGLVSSLEVKMPDRVLTIIVVNWNGIDFLPTCIRSIAENPPSVPFEVVVVDNESDDGSVDWFNSAEAKSITQSIKVKVIESGGNLGFGRANNLAFEYSDSPFVMILNPDTIVTNGSIDKLIETLATNENAGVAAPKLLNNDGSFQHNVWSSPPSSAKILVDGLKLYKLIPNSLLSHWLYGKHFDYTQRRNVPAVSGAAMCVRREVIEKVGGFDDSIFMYGEDLDWCFRINKAGWQIIYEPVAEIFHHSGRSAVQRWNDLDRNLKEEWAVLEFQRKHLSKRSLFFNTLSRAFVLSIYRLRRRLRRLKSDNLDDLIKLQIEFCRLALMPLRKSNDKSSSVRRHY